MRHPWLLYAYVFILWCFIALLVWPRPPSYVEPTHITKHSNNKNDSFNGMSRKESKELIDSVLGEAK